MVTLEEALKLAKEKELDLVEVAPNIDPPVCKILDYGKHLYHQKKIDQKHRKQQKKNEVKGVRISLRTGDHDLDVKLKRARKFLGDRHTIKVSLIFKGREISHLDIAKEKMVEFAEKLEDIANIESPPKRQGFNLIMILIPK